MQCHTESDPNGCLIIPKLYACLAKKSENSIAKPARTPRLVLHVSMDTPLMLNEHRSHSDELHRSDHFSGIWIVIYDSGIFLAYREGRRASANM